MPLMLAESCVKSFEFKRKREQNRISARKLRLKKELSVEEMEKNCKTVSQQNETLEEFLNTKHFVPNHQETKTFVGAVDEDLRIINEGNRDFKQKVKKKNLFNEEKPLSDIVKRVEAIWKEKNCRDDRAVFLALKGQYENAFIFKAIRAAESNRKLPLPEKHFAYSNKNENKVELGHSVKELQLIQDALLNENSRISTIRCQGVSPLMYAASICNEDLALAVLEKALKETSPVGFPDPRGGDVGDHGYTPLHYACQYGMVRLVKALLDANHSISCQTNDLRLQMNIVQSGGKTPLHLAAERLDNDVCKLLVDCSVAGQSEKNILTISDLDGNTPYVLSLMASNGKREGKPEKNRKNKGGDEIFTLLYHSPDLLSLEVLRASEKLETCLFPIYSQPWISWKIECDILARKQRATDSFRVREDLKSPYTLKNVMSEEECNFLLQHLKDHTDKMGWRSERHRGGTATTTDVPCAEVGDKSFNQFVQSLIKERIFTEMSKRHAFALNSFSFRDLFFVKYEVGEKNNKDCKKSLNGW
eukprot:g2691.t1